MLVTQWVKDEDEDENEDEDEGGRKTLPEAQRTQGIDSLTLVISPAK